MLTLDAARAAVALWPDHAQLAAIVEAVERGLEERSDTVIDAAKCLVEATCREILQERGIEAEADASVQKLVRAAMGAVGLHDDGAGDVVTRAFNGWLTAAQGLGEMRNHFGVLSHGRARASYALRQEQRLIAARLSESFVALLIEAHLERDPDLLHTRQVFEGDSLLNERIDEIIVVRADEDTGEVILGDLARLRPSQLLYAHDREAYIEAMNLLPALRSVVIKTDPCAVVPGEEVVVVERALAGVVVERGDLAFVWFSGRNGGLAFCGRVISADQQGAGVEVTLRARRPVTTPAISTVQLAPFRDALADRPEATLSHKLYRHAHNKIAALSDAEVEFLAAHFRDGL